MSRISRLLGPIREALRSTGSEAVKMAAGFPGSQSVRSYVRENPLTSAGLAAGAAMPVTTEILSPALGGLKGAFIDPFKDILGVGTGEIIRDREAYDDFREAQTYRMGEKLRKQRIQEMVERNMQIVASRDPHLFNQVMAGRVLPQGAVVLGGPRRQDLMEELAYAMGTSETPEEFSSLFS